MKIIKMVQGIFMLVFLFVSLSDIFATDWSQWRGPNRDGKTDDFQPPSEWPAVLSQQWSVKVGSGDASPVLVDDKLYIHVRENDKHRGKGQGEIILAKSIVLKIPCQKYDEQGAQALGCDIAGY